jgi:hypothetical protein
MMKRRESIKTISSFVCGTIIIPSSTLMMNSCSSPGQELSWLPEFLENENAFFLTELSNTVLPNTEFPGAIALGVPQEIEKYIFNVYDEKDITKFIEDLNTIKIYLIENNFYELILSEKTILLNNLQKMKRNKKIRKIYMSFKKLIIESYFLTEVGATQVLRYNGPSVVLGDYRGCVPFGEIGKTWAI